MRNDLVLEIKELSVSFRRYETDAGVDRLYPFQLSGGMARRVLLSTAVLLITPAIIFSESLKHIRDVVASFPVRFL
jgi:ABC-type transporter Mla maintaining outer membrane lipid asymmetry ATPase subunit MlaF